MPDIEIEGPDGNIFAFPEGMSEGAMKTALIRHYQTEKRNAPPVVEPGDASAAVGQGIVNGIPIVGPYIAGGLTNVAAGIRALQDGTTFPEAKAKVQAFNEATRTAHPFANGAGEIGGAVAGTIPAMAAAPAMFGIGTAALPLRMAASGATSGVLGSADAAIRDQNPILGGIGGLAGGVAAPAIAAGVGKAAGAIASKFSPAAAVPSIAELKASGRAAYQAADEAGVQISAPAFAQGLGDVASAVREHGFNAKLYPKAAAALEEMSGQLGASPTLKDVELLRRVAKGAAGSIEPAEANVGRVMVDKLDNFTGKLKPSDLVSGDAETAVAKLGEARDLWGRARRGQLVDDALEKANLRAASTGSGGNVDNAARQEIRQILTNPKKVRGFSEAEREAMTEFVEGSGWQNAARLAGKLSPVGNGLMAALGIGATAANPMLASIPAAGILSKFIADRGSTKAAGLLSNMVRNGGEVPVSGLALPWQQAGEELGGLLTVGARKGAHDAVQGLLSANSGLSTNRR